MKKLYGKTKIDGENSGDFSKVFLIKLKYYKTRELVTKENEKKFGIEVIKEELNGKNKVKEKSVARNISNNEQFIERLLNIFVQNKVTPIATNEILSDLRKCPEMLYNRIDK